MRYGPEWGAAGAMWGVALSEAVALVYLMVVYSANRRKELRNGERLQIEGPKAPASGRRLEPTAPEGFGKIAKGLLKLALPMMAGAIFLPLASLADASIVVNRLTDLGYSGEATQALYGILSGMVNVLVNVPSVLSLSIGTSLIPAIAESNERRDLRSVERKCRVGLKMTLLLSLPSAVGLAVLSRPILGLLYGPALTQAQLAIGGDLLALSAASVIFLSVVQSTNGVLQGVGRVTVPMISLAIGATVKIVLNYFLIGIPSVNIHGAPIGTMLCYLIPAVINLVFVRKATGMRLKNIAGMLVKPALAAVCMGGAAWSMATYLPAVIGAKPAAAIAVFVSVPAYAFFAVFFGAVGRDELSFLPKGDRIADFLDRVGLLRK
jgi:stage V sporulation protein B